MARFMGLTIVLLFYSTLDPQQARALTIDEMRETKDIVKELCQHPDRKGRYMQVEGTLEGGAIIRIVGIKGKATITRKQWEGVQDVLPQDRAPDREDVRSCAEYLTPLLLEKLEDAPPAMKYRPPQYFSGFGHYTLTPRDWVQLPFVDVEEDERDASVLGGSWKSPPGGYCRIAFKRDAYCLGCRRNKPPKIPRTYTPTNYGCNSSTHVGTRFVESIGAILSYRVVEMETLTMEVDIFSRQPERLRRPTKVRPGDSFGSFEVGSIEAGWSHGDLPGTLRVNIGEGRSSRYLTEGERYVGENADVLVREIGTDGFGHFAHIGVNYR